MTVKSVVICCAFRGSSTAGGRATSGFGPTLLGVMHKLLWLIPALAATALAADNALVDRVGSTGFIQIEAESFRSLSARQQALAYWLSQAAIAIDPINYDQNSIYGLRQKRLLELVVKYPNGVTAVQDRTGR